VIIFSLFFSKSTPVVELLMLSKTVLWYRMWSMYRRESLFILI